MKVSIRDLMWLTLAVAFAVGWWVERRNSLTLEDDLKESRADTKYWMTIGKNYEWSLRHAATSKDNTK